MSSCPNGNNVCSEAGEKARHVSPQSSETNVGVTSRPDGGLPVKGPAPSSYLNTVKPTSTKTSSNEDEASDDHKAPPSGAQEAADDERKPPARQEAADEGSSSVNKEESFSTLLMRMLNTGSRAVRWLPDGNGFVILHQNSFERRVLPKYFGTSCRFQSFTKRLYRWGFKMMERSKAGSGQFVFIHEAFHRDSTAYLEMKPLPRIRSKPRDQTDPTNARSSASSQRFNDDNSVVVASENEVASSDNTATASQAEALQNITTETMPNGNIPVLPPQVASAQNELTQLVNTIVSTYAASPVLMSSLQSDLINILQGIPPAWPNLMQQQISSHSNASMNQAHPTGDQEPVTSILAGVMRFLTQQREQGSLSLDAESQAQNSLPPTINTSMNAMGQQSLPATMPPSIQGYNALVQQGLMNIAGLQSLLGNQATVDQRGMLPVHGQGAAANNPDTMTLLQSLLGNNVAVDQGGMLPAHGPALTTCVETTTTTAESSASGAASETTTETSHGQAPNGEASPTNDDDAMPPESNNRKRERSPTLNQ